MRLLIDTHVVIWLLNDSPRLPPYVRAQLADHANTIHASVISIWEISIKQARGILQMPDGLVTTLEASGIELLPVTAAHAYAVRSLPPLHRDPFDRMIITQAVLENMMLVTHDATMRSYPVACLKI